MLKLQFDRHDSVFQNMKMHNFKIFLHWKNKLRWWWSIQILSNFSVYHFKLAQRTKSRPIFPKIVKTEATNVFTSKARKSFQIFGPLLYENL